MTKLTRLSYIQCLKLLKKVRRNPMPWHQKDLPTNQRFLTPTSLKVAFRQLRGQSKTTRGSEDWEVFHQQNNKLKEPQELGPSDLNFFEPLHDISLLVLLKMICWPEIPYFFPYQNFWTHWRFPKKENCDRIRQCMTRSLQEATIDWSN